MKKDPLKLSTTDIQRMRKLVDGCHKLGFLFNTMSDCGRFRRYRVYRVVGEVIEDVTQTVAALAQVRFTSSGNMSVEGDCNTVIELLNERLQVFLNQADGYVTMAQKFTDIQAKVDRTIKFEHYPL